MKRPIADKQLDLISKEINKRFALENLANLPLFEQIKQCMKIEKEVFKEHGINLTFDIDERASEVCEVIEANISQSPQDPKKEEPASRRLRPFEAEFLNPEPEPHIQEQPSSKALLPDQNGECPNSGDEPK